MGAQKYFLKVGDLFGNWTLLKKSSNATWLCRCKCGVEKLVRQDSLATGTSKSCGCESGVLASKKLKKHGHATGYSPEYRAWHHMRERCYNKNDKRYDDYGGRGIVVCDRWMESFENFLADMGLRPSKEYSLDRFPNNDGNYEPSNCRWATRLQQMNGRRNTVFIEYEGQKYSITDLAAKLGKSREWVRARYVDGIGPPNRKNVDAILGLIKSGVNTTNQINKSGVVDKKLTGRVLWGLKKKGVISKIDNKWVCA